MPKKLDSTLIDQECAHLINYVCFSNLNPFDAYIGHMIKSYRKAANMTQQQVAFLLDVTFQQIQKYEKGTNRLSAERLWDISKALNVPYLSFFKGLDTFIKKVKEVQQNSCLKSTLSFKENSQTDNTSKLEQSEPNFEEILTQLSEIENNSDTKTTSFSIFQKATNQDINDFYTAVSAKMSQSDEETYKSVLSSTHHEDIEKLDKLCTSYLNDETDFSTFTTQLKQFSQKNTSLDEDEQEITLIHK